MDADWMQLTAEVAALKFQLNELWSRQIEAAALGGSGAGIGEVIVPIGVVPTGETAPRIPGNFEPTFEADPSDNNTVKLAHVGNGYVPFGRRFYLSGSDSHLHDSAKISTGLIYLEVVHPTSSSSIPQILVKGEGESSPRVDFTQASTNVSFIPLYEIANGKMILDYRSCMSLTVREV